MPYLKFYQVENFKYADLRKVCYTDIYAEQIVRKLARHYKIKIAEVKFRGKKENGFACWRDNSIKLCHSPNIVLICHEFAHHYEHQKHNNKRHDKRLALTVKRLLAYCQKKEFFMKGST